MAVVGDFLAANASRSISAGQEQGMDKQPQSERTLGDVVKWCLPRKGRVRSRASVCFKGRFARTGFASRMSAESLSPSSSPSHHCLPLCRIFCSDNNPNSFLHSTIPHSRFSLSVAPDILPCSPCHAIHMIIPRLVAIQCRLMHRMRPLAVTTLI